MDDFLDKLKGLTRNSDLAVGLMLVVVLAVMIIPINPVILDLFIAISLSIAMIILLLSIYSKRPLDFSTFPSVLLIATLFRLSLNVASTRNILLRAGSDGPNAAGEIIRSFGSYVVQGNFAVGIIIFIILVIINFIVITKGAGRVAEVAARFTLDAMPGKQMAIDADLSSGLINEEQARIRRKDVAGEADFYGSMDGASKFVRGDAIAGILITAINIIGGIIVGVAQYDMSFSEAGNLFVLLTVGDGLVSQIPALIISTAAGVIVTRNTSDDSLGSQISKQIKMHPKALYACSGILLVFAAVPGLPSKPFIAIALIMILMAYQIKRSNIVDKEREIADQIESKKAKAENLEELLSLEMVELNVGYGLVSLVDVDQNGDLLERISHIRKQFTTDWGIIIPAVHIKDDLELKPGGYSIKIKGIEVANGELMPDYFLAIDPGTVIEKIDGITAREPVFGLDAVWVTDDQKDDAQYNGYTVIDLSTVIATHLTEIVKNNLHEIFGRQELVTVLDKLKDRYPKIVEDLIPEICPLGIVLSVLQNLLKEGISIRDLRTILEALADNGEKIKDKDLLTEAVRQSLYRSITELIKNENGEIPLFTLDRNIEEAIAKSIIQTELGNKLSLDPMITQNILASLNEKIEEATSVGEKMVVLCSPTVRYHFKRLTEKFIPNLIVVSHNELAADINIKSLGTVRL